MHWEGRNWRPRTGRSSNPTRSSRTELCRHIFPDRTSSGAAPNGVGVEASGIIEAVGVGVFHVAPGDRVAYTGSPLGAYSTERICRQRHW